MILRELALLLGVCLKGLECLRVLLAVALLLHIAFKDMSVHFGSGPLKNRCLYVAGADVSSASRAGTSSASSASSTGAAASSSSR